ncbi:MAG: glycoside hydrolase family 88 protein [Planctomycetia bacterium]|nr:glycoside hydrolase family 88 protein [Planctomycetia bacterium]
MKPYLRGFVCIVMQLGAAAATVAGAEPNATTDSVKPTAIGVTREGNPIEAYIAEPNGYESKKIRVLLVSGLTGRNASGLLPKAGVDGELSISTVSLDRNAASDAKPGTHQFPPSGDFYQSPTQVEAQYLWRWIGMHAPDLVVEVVTGDAEEFHLPASSFPRLKTLSTHLPNLQVRPFSDEPLTCLNETSPCAVGIVPAMRVVAKTDAYWNTLKRALTESKLPPSSARIEIQKRLARTPEQVAAQLLEVYGKQLSSVQYIPALALVGRLRHELSREQKDAPVSPIVLAAVEPYLSSAKPTLAPKAGGSGTAGNLLFGELAAIIGEKRYVELVKAAADQAFDSDDKPREAMPAHSEMSDAVFMGCPILAQAGKLTGDDRYFDACLRNLRFMQKLCLRKDGLYRHSPLDESAWGRGNGFPALGLAWSLAEIPESYAGRAEMLDAFRNHMDAVLPHQDASGCWHQVIDHPESYREFTCTAMTTFALARGVRLGWLKSEKYDAAIKRGWDALRARIGTDGGLVDVCTGTGKMKSLRDYYDRTAILGRDDRGGAMALMVTTEMELYLRALGR